MSKWRSGVSYTIASYQTICALTRNTIAQKCCNFALPSENLPTRSIV